MYLYCKTCCRSSSIKSTQLSKRVAFCTQINLKVSKCKTQVHPVAISRGITTSNYQAPWRLRFISTLRILAPSNGRVWTCIAGVPVLKIATFEGSKIQDSYRVLTWRKQLGMKLQSKNIIPQKDIILTPYIWANDGQWRANSETYQGILGVGFPYSSTSGDEPAVRLLQFAQLLYFFVVGCVLQSGAPMCPSHNSNLASGL